MRKKLAKKTKARKKKAPSARRTRRVVKKRVASRVTRPKTKKPILDQIGKVTHYFPKVKAGVVKVTKGVLTLGDTIHIKGHTTDFKQRVASLQLDHQPIEKAQTGQEVGLLVKSRVRQHDLVYKV